MVRSKWSKWTAGLSQLRQTAAAAGSNLTSPDGRWALVSTSLTATIAGSVACLALAAAPPSSARTYEPRRVQAALPYELLVGLTGARPATGSAGGEASRMPSKGGVTAAPADEPLDNALADEQLGVAVPGMPRSETRTLRVDNGDTFIGLLSDAGVAPEDVLGVVNALRPVFGIHKIHSGLALTARFGPPQGTERAAPTLSRPGLGGSANGTLDAATDETVAPVRLLELSFSPSPEHRIVVNRSAEGAYTAQDVITKLESRYRHAGATIDTSLYLAAVQAGLPDEIVVEMIRIFSYDVDFQRDVHAGDSFEVFYNGYYTPDGQPAKEGELLAATMTLGGKKRTLYRYETNDGGVEYFDAFGRSAKSMLMKTPIDGARISSGFGMRQHPILGYSKMHKGIDFAAPLGTPVVAAGSGTVVEAGWKGGYGRFLRVRHADGYETAYGHLSRLAVGRGARVRQGQTIAYVGMTGDTTGPHLHYEIRIAEAQMNPLTVKIAAGRQLLGKELKSFLVARARTDKLAGSMPLQKSVANIDWRTSTR